MTATTSSRSAQLLALVTISLALRSPLFGAWNHDLDDQFYALIGTRLREGALLYVDVWDRKGPALYYLYALLTGSSGNPLGYQIAAALSAALGGYGVNRLARLIAEPLAALLAGIAYCVLLIQFGGENGQAPVFYNTLIVWGAWTMATRLESQRRGRIDGTLVAGMGACGLAILFKQSAAIESLFFGLVAIGCLARRRNATRRLTTQIALLALAGALPISAGTMRKATSPRSGRLPWNPISRGTTAALPCGSRASSFLPVG